MSLFLSAGAVPASAAAQQRVTWSRRQETSETEVSPAQHLKTNRL